MSAKRFEFVNTHLKDLLVVQRKSIDDRRGFFSRFYCADEFAAMGIDKPIMQINHTFTLQKGAVRGLHFQMAPHSEAKFVSCIKGEILDVAVDLRRDSPTFLQWHGEILSAANRKSLLIPEGYAHGFQALTVDCELLYLHTASYHPESEGGINVADPTIGIVWPLTITDISDRDRNLPLIEKNFQGLTV